MTGNFDRFLIKLRSPRSWRIRTRRIFLVLLPVSLPVWLLALLSFGIINGLRAGFRPIATFWTAPPKRPHSYYGYRPLPKQKKQAEVITLHQEKAA
jgi:hypothetical protein